MKKINYLLFAILVFQTSCMPSCKESALSDVIITQPEILNVQAKLDVSNDVNGNKNTVSSVWVKDKNKQALVLKDGKISINDRNITMVRSFIGNLPYYEASGNVIPVNAGGKYKLDITLGDGQLYSSNLNVPNDIPEYFEVPTYHNPGNELVVKWDKVPATGSNRLRWTKFYYRDSTDISSSSSGSIEIRPGKTQHAFSPSFFTEGSYKVNSVEFILSSEINGQINSAFASNSSYEACFTFNRKLTVE